MYVWVWVHVQGVNEQEASLLELLLSEVVRISSEVLEMAERAEEAEDTAGMAEGPEEAQDVAEMAERAGGTTQHSGG